MCAVRALSTATNGNSLIGLLPNLPPNIHALEFAGDEYLTFIIWGDARGAISNVSFPSAALLSATDMLGQGLDLSFDDAQTAVVEISEEVGPIYLKFRKPATNRSSHRISSRYAF